MPEQTGISDPANHDLETALKRFEKLIVRDAEAFEDPLEREAEFHRRLERTRRLLDALGSPQDGLPAIHIGGTSGKGSVAMICEAILSAAGLKVGTHTSPYLQTPLEKVRISQRLASPEPIIALTETVLRGVEQVQQAAPELGHPHYAEAWLGLALRHFADQACQAAVIEVGMGGRYDSTNVISPRVSVMTTVHYDHVRVLGDTLEEIAYHKAGIIKPGVPAVAGEMAAQAMAVIQEEAAWQQSRLLRLSHDFHAHHTALKVDGSTFDYEGYRLRLNGLAIHLIGQHQVANAAVALAALELFSEATGIPIPEEAIREGLQQVRFAGRLEIMQREPTVMLDGAHNEEKVGALIAAVRALFRYRRLVMVLGLLEAKNAGPILEQFCNLADVIITTAPHVKGKPAIPAEEVASVIERAGNCEVLDGGSPIDALQQALDIAQEDDLVLVTGSLYLIGTVRERWHSAAQIIAARTMFPSSDYPPADVSLV